MPPADTPAPSRWPVTLVWLAALTALQLTLFFGLVGYIPRTRATFDAHGLQLPAVALLAISVADLYAPLWPVLLPAGLLAVTAGVIVGRHRFRTPRPGNVFAAVCLFLMLAFLAATATSVGLAYLKLAEGMAK